MRTRKLRSSILRRLRWMALAAALLSAATGCSASSEGLTETRSVVTDAQYAMLDQMNKHAERAYQSMKDGDIEGARGRMVQLSAAASSLTYEGLTSIEGVAALTETISAALHSLNAIQPKEHEMMLKIIRVRLAVDALRHKEMPMWLEFHKPLADDLSALQNAVIKRDKDGANMALNKWKAHVQMIRPAVLVSRDASKAVILDSMTVFFENHIEKKEWKKLLESMPNLSEAFHDLFRQQDKQQETIAPLAPSAEPPHPILWSLALGSIIVIVLTYAAWRRYEAEAAYVKVKREKDVDGIL